CLRGVSNLLRAPAMRLLLYRYAHLPGARVADALPSHAAAATAAAAAAAAPAAPVITSALACLLHTFLVAARTEEAATAGALAWCYEGS
ncbi:hypothetical protein OFB72_29645, partial [Escherichia coli]|nr:hypothetical protein [Escherichia coli]